MQTLIQFRQVDYLSIFMFYSLCKKWPLHGYLRIVFLRNQPIAVYSRDITQSFDGKVLLVEVAKLPMSP